MAFGNSNPVNIVMQLIIDDGVPDRGHRTSIFNKGNGNYVTMKR